MADLDGGMGDWDDCEGQGGYSDMSAGAFVSVEDQEGIKIGGSTLRNVTTEDIERLVENDGSVDESEFRESLSDFQGFLCVFGFDVEVADADVYVIEFGNNRGELTYTKDQLEENDYFVALELGDA